MVSADEPDRARGLNLSYCWCDEFAAWRYEETWTAGLAPALRIGNPQTIITTTPRPTKLIREFMARTDGSVVVTRGSTFDNSANLSPAALAELRQRYDGTRIGRQELYGEVLTDTPGALWSLASIENARISETNLPELVRVVVAVDPAVTSGENSDETGIVVVAKTADGRGVVLADRSCRDTPSGWAHRAIQAFEDFHADRIVAEKNQGGDMVEATLRSVMPSVPYKGVTAKQGKRLRAEPIAALYEQGRVSHAGVFDTLEDQMTSWLPDSGYSPDRLDALVHGLTELGLAYGSSADRFFAELAPPCAICGMPVQQGSTSCPSCGAKNNDYDLTMVYPR
jgi:phage terminase large subunit-like protein